MAYGDIKRLTAQGAQLGATVGTVYTAPSGKAAQIGTILLHNTGDSTIDVQIFSNGDTAAARFLYISLSASETYELSPKVPIVLQGSETLRGLASTAAKVNILAYGREEI